MHALPAGMVPVIVSWFISPCLAALVTLVMFLIVRTAVLRRQNSTKLAYICLPIFVLLVRTALGMCAWGTWLLVRVFGWWIERMRLQGRCQVHSRMGEGGWCAGATLSGSPVCACSSACSWSTTSAVCLCHPRTKLLLLLPLSSTLYLSKHLFSPV